MSVLVRPRARALGIAIGLLTPGPLNAITDVPGVKVGQVTLVEGDGRMVPGRGPVRTGVTAILPHGGNLFREKVVGATHVINGFGKSVGLPQVDELGVIETPILLTNTLNVPRVADALIDYMIEQNPGIGITTSTVNPVVGECNDGYLNDIQGRHVGRAHVFQALQGAMDGPVEEGAVGAGTGMSAFEFKGGIGTASRRLPASSGGFSVGALVLSNFGRRAELVIDGVPVGREIPLEGKGGDGAGSIIMVVGTDAPVTSRQLQRLARRAGIGLARTGSLGGHGSGDFVIAFSTANPVSRSERRNTVPMEVMIGSRSRMNPFYQASIEAVEEAVLNSLLMAETTEGRDGNMAYAIPIDELLAVLRKYGRGAK